MTGMNDPEFKTSTRIHFGTDALARLGTLVRELGGTRVLLVADAGLVDAGHVGQATDIMRESQLEVFHFNDFHENPTSAMAETGTCAAREWSINFIVGLGGGSSMDCAKAINFILTNGGGMADYWGYGKAEKPMLPMLAIPTTAGTGSEVQSYALITDPQSHRKMACGDPKAAFKAAILDPKLTVSQPASVTAAAGYDAIGHAVETFVTTKRTKLSQFFSMEAWRLLDKNYEVVLREPENLEARGGMQLGACLAGVAIENSMLGATHALANPLTERYEITHGVAIAILLHHVVRWNSGFVRKHYDELAEISGNSTPDWLAGRLQELLGRSGLPVRLSQVGVERDQFPNLSQQALQQWTGTFNPRPLNQSDVEALYEAAY